MTRDIDEGDHAGLSPDAAFSVLGDETRLQILQTLGQATESLSFSELRERLGRPDPGQFNYHLDKLVGPFVAKTDEGYALRKAGSNVVEVLLTRAVTGEPNPEPIEVDEPCPHCGASIDVQVHQGKVAHFCTECEGTYAGPQLPEDSLDTDDRGFLGALSFPLSGFDDRTVEESVAASAVWGHLNLLRAANGLCPRCAESVTSTVEVCEDHPRDEVCPNCGSRHRVRVAFDCPHCVFGATPAVADALLADVEFVRFLVDHGINPVSPTMADMAVWVDYEENVRSLDPFEGRFTFTADGERLTLTVDDDLSVVDATRSTTSSV